MPTFPHETQRRFRRNLFDGRPFRRRRSFARRLLSLSWRFYGCHSKEGQSWPETAE
jgi:hypothetical protein